MDFWPFCLYFSSVRITGMYSRDTAQKSGYFHKFNANSDLHILGISMAVNFWCWKLDYKTTIQTKNDGQQVFKIKLIAKCHITLYSTCDVTILVSVILLKTNRVAIYSESINYS